MDVAVQDDTARLARIENSSQAAKESVIRGFRARVWRVFGRCTIGARWGLAFVGDRDFRNIIDEGTPFGYFRNPMSTLFSGTAGDTIDTRFNVS